MILLAGIFGKLVGKHIAAVKRLKNKNNHAKLETTSRDLGTHKRKTHRKPQSDLFIQLIITYINRTLFSYQCRLLSSMCSCDIRFACSLLYFYFFFSLSCSNVVVHGINLVEVVLVVAFYFSMLTNYGTSVWFADVCVLCVYQNNLNWRPTDKRHPSN